MKITIEIPNEYEAIWRKSGFAKCLNNVATEAVIHNGDVSDEEIMLVEMLEEAFYNAHAECLPEQKVGGENDNRRP